MDRKVPSIPAVLAFAGAACMQSGRERLPADARPTLFDGMGRHHRPIATASPEAQAFFDQGLVRAYAFSHDEAIRSFGQAARLDPGCAMAWWGVALCHGPHINNPVMSAERSRAAWEALQKAVALRGRAGAVERELIDALTRRCAGEPPADRRDRLSPRRHRRGGRRASQGRGDRG